MTIVQALAIAVTVAGLAEKVKTRSYSTRSTAAGNPKALKCRSRLSGARGHSPDRGTIAGSAFEKSLGTRDSQQPEEQRALLQARLSSRYHSYRLSRSSRVALSGLMPPGGICPLNKISTCRTVSIA